MVIEFVDPVLVDPVAGLNQKVTPLDDAVFCEFQILGLDVLAAKSDADIAPASTHAVVSFRIRPPKNRPQIKPCDPSDASFDPLRHLHELGGLFALLQNPAPSVRAKPIQIKPF